MDTVGTVGAVGTWMDPGTDSGQSQAIEMQADGCGPSALPYNGYCILSAAGRSASGGAGESLTRVF